MRILWGSPLPPVRSGVSDYAVELLAELGRRARVRVLRPPQWSCPEGWPLEGVVEVVATETEAEAGEVPLIHLGNNPHHLWLLHRLEAAGTAVVLHDLVLHHLLVEAAGAGLGEGLEQALRRAHGEPGAALARARGMGIAGRRDPFLFPARSAVLQTPAAVVVHSAWAQKVVEAELPGVPCGRIGLPATDPGAIDRRAARERLGFGGDELVLMHLGFLTPEKGLHRILAAVAAAVALEVPVRLVLVGEGRGLGDVTRAAAAAGVADRVRAVGWLDRASFLAAPAAADLGVVLRTPSAGETSAAAVRFLACGTPVAVGGGPQFLEWPEAAAPRLTPGPAAAADLARLLAAAVADPPAWESRRLAARTAYEAQHRPERSAEDLLTFLSRMPPAAGELTAAARG